MDISKLLKSIQSSNKDTSLADSSEKIYISPLALLKMLKHCRAGVPMEVMGLMLGHFVDDYTIIVKDVFAMPQSGTTVTVESIDPVFQTKMLDMLKQTNRSEMVIGWYHSHPGFGCWLSNIDTNTQQSFESLNSRAVAVVVDPIQSVRGKVVIDAFRLISSNPLMPIKESREHTSVEGFLRPPEIQALIHGLNKSYYSINIKFGTSSEEENIMLSLYESRKNGLQLEDFEAKSAKDESRMAKALELSRKFNKQLDQQMGKTKNELEMMRVGLLDCKRHLNELIDDLVDDSLSQRLAADYDLKVF